MTDTPSSRIAIIATHGTLDAAYPPLILATAALALEMDAAIFFTTPPGVVAAAPPSSSSSSSAPKPRLPTRPCLCPCPTSSGCSPA